MHAATEPERGTRMTYRVPPYTSPLTNVSSSHSILVADPRSYLTDHSTPSRPDHRVELDGALRPWEDATATYINMISPTRLAVP